MRNKIFLGLLVVSLLLLLLFIPIEVPFTIDTYGKILPSEQWIILHTQDGRFQTKLIDNKTGLSRNVFETQFERGDAGKFEILDGIKQGSKISRGETIAKISSDFSERELINLKGELEETNATLKLFESGEKEEIINEIKSRLSYSEKQAEEENRIFLRQQKLFEKELIAEEEFEIFRGKKELAELNVITLRAKLDIVKSGSKKEQIDYLKTKIKSLQNQINKSQELLEKYIFKSQINGTITGLMQGDTILIVANADDYILLVPVELKLRSYVENNQIVEFVLPFTDQTLNASIFSFNGQPQIINNKYFIVSYELMD